MLADGEQEASSGPFARQRGRLFDEAERIAGFGVWRWDIDDNRVVWTPNLYRLFGVDPEAFDATFAGYLSCVHPEDRALVERQIRRAVEAREDFHFDHRVILPDGGTRHISCHGEVLEEPHLHMVGIAQDVTARKRQEKAVQQANSLLAATLESTADGFLVIAPDRQIVLMNQIFIDQWRIPPEIVKSKDRPALLRHALSQLRNPVPFARRIEELYDRPDEVSRDVLELADGRIFEGYSRPQRIDGAVVGRVWSMRDVTEQAHAMAQRQQALLEEQVSRAAAEDERRRSQFLADASALLASLDYETALTGVARLCVPTLANWCAIDLFDETGTTRRVATFSDEPLPPSLRAELQRVTPTGLPLDIDPLARHPENLRRVRELGMRSYLATPLVVPGRTLGVLTLVSTVEGKPYGPADLQLAQNLSERTALAVENARLYLATQEALRLRDEFLSIASHELNTPLTSLLLGVQTLKAFTLKHGGVPPEDYERMLTKAERQVKHLRSLVGQLLDVTRLEAHTLTLEPTLFDLTGLVRDVVERFREQAERTGATLTLAGAPPIAGRWDKLRVDEVVSNLISNAIKYGAGGPIDVTVSVDQRRAFVEVVDHGIGIPADQLDRLFQRFERGVSARHYGGLGLGLYISREVMREMGGTVSVRSAAGGGSRFCVELPREGGP